MFPPGFTPVKRLFNEHCCRSEEICLKTKPTKAAIPECLECDDDMSHVEFCLQIECDVDASLPIGSLPPGQVLLASRILRRLVLVNNFGHRVTVIVGITNVTFCVLLVTPPIQRGDYTVTFWSIHTTGIVGSQHVFPPDEQVAGGRVAGALITSHHVPSPRLLGLSCSGEKLMLVHHQRKESISPPPTTNTTTTTKKGWQASTVILKEEGEWCKGVSATRERLNPCKVCGHTDILDGVGRLADGAAAGHDDHGYDVGHDDHQNDLYAVYVVGLHVDLLRCL